MTRAFTPEGLRQAFLRHIRASVKYWASLNKSDEEKLDGLAFSLSASDLQVQHLAKYTSQVRRELIDD